MEKPGASVIDMQGEVGVLDDMSHLDRPGEAVVRLASGERVLVPTAMISASPDGSYRLDRTFRELRQRSLPHGGITDGPVREEIIPVVEEAVRVEKRSRETGRVRVAKHVTEHTETVDEPLLREEVEVTRVLVNRVLNEPVGIRHEGDLMIIPVLEERLVVRKEVVLKEELHVRRRSSVHHDPQEISFRSETVDIDRIPSKDGPD
jgi:uncharacterized protein (TIGR02271 family)